MIPEISQSHLHKFETDGFCVLENVFSIPEMEALSSAIEVYQAKHEQRLSEVGVEGISRADEISFTSHLAEQDEDIRKFCVRPEFVAITTTFLGPNTDLYWNQAVFKGPDGKAQFPWHQDDGYTQVTPSPYLTLWLALNDATVENGCIWVLPGSQKRGLVDHVYSPIGKVCHSLDDPDQGVPVPLHAGSIAAFQSLTMHKSGVNHSSGVRKAYIVQYSHSGLKDAQTGEIFQDKIPVARNGNAV